VALSARSYPGLAGVRVFALKPARPYEVTGGPITCNT